MVNRCLSKRTLGRTCNTTYGSGQVVARQRLDVLDLERLDIQVVEPQQGNGVLDIEAQRKGAHKVLALLQGACVGSVLARTELYALVLEVHPNLQLEVLDQGRVDFWPG